MDAARRLSQNRHPWKQPMQQQPITMTEKQVFEMFHKCLLAGTFRGEHVVQVANAIIFCERIAQAPESVMQPSQAEPPAEAAKPDLHVAHAAPDVAGVD